MSDDFIAKIIDQTGKYDMGFRNMKIHCTNRWQIQQLKNNGFISNTGAGYNNNMIIDMDFTMFLRIKNSLYYNKKIKLFNVDDEIIQKLDECNIKYDIIDNSTIELLSSDYQIFKK